MTKRVRVLLNISVVFGYLFSACTIGTAQDWGSWQDGSVFKTRVTTDVPLREAPPSQGFLFLRIPGKEISTLKKGESVEVLGHKEVSTLFSDYVWVHIKKTDSSGQQTTGWVYWGNNKDHPVNFEPPKQEK